MFKTPPMTSQEKFCSPQKENHFPQTPQSVNKTSSMSLDTDTPKSHLNTFESITPKSRFVPHSAGISVSTLFDSDQTLLPLSPATSPVSLCHSSPLTSSPSTIRGNSPSSISRIHSKTATWDQILPTSMSFNEIEIVSSIEDSVIDIKFNEDLKIEKQLGRGAFSTVLACVSYDHKFAIKIPKNFRSSKHILKEMLNFKIISSYLQLNNLDTADIPILNAYGITFLDKFKYSSIKQGETLPCLVSSILSSNLETLINNSKPTSTNLHIGNELWWKLAKQLLIGLIILKNCSMVHLDLKTSNILYDSINQNFKIGDFTSAGLQEDIEHQYYKLLENDSYFDVTLQYCAPELVKSPPSIPNFQTDLYSVGLILLSAAIGQEPYTEYLKSQNPANMMIVLNQCITKNKILDLVSFRKMEILEQNKDAFDLIRMILIDRSPLETVVSSLNDI